MFHLSGNREPSRASLLRKAGVAAASLAAGIFGAVAIPAAANQSASSAALQVATNQAARSTVALAIDSTGAGFAFYRGQNDAVYMRTFRNGIWSSSQVNLGGKIIGAPAATIAGTNKVVVATRGTGSVLWLRTRTNGVWGSWRSWGGKMSSSPAITGTSSGRIDVFTRWTDNAIWARTKSSAGVLAQWKSLGGRLTTAPAAAWFGGALSVYAASTDHAVWTKSMSGGVWSAWKSIGGHTYSTPAKGFIPQSNTAFVFIRGTDNVLYAKSVAAGASTGWQSLAGTVVVDGPTAAGTSAGTPYIIVAVRSSDTAVRTKRYLADGTGWSAFSRAWIPAAPPAPASWLLGKDWTRIPTTAKVVALTFDAGANADGLPSIESTLRTKIVRATFFLTGNWVRTYPGKANLIAQGGYEVGNHSVNHPYFTKLTDAQVTAQVRDAQLAIIKANGVDPRPLFRFPYGDVNSRVLADVNGLGYVAVRWTVDSLGWKGTSGGMTVQKVIDRVLAAAKPGAIVLMHLGSNPDDHTTLDAAALPQIINTLRARGYTFVTMRALTG